MKCSTFKIVCLGMILLVTACGHLSVYDDLVSFEVRSQNATAYRAIPASILREFEASGGSVITEVESFVPARKRPVNSIQLLPKTDVYIVPICGDKLLMANREFVAIRKGGTVKVVCP